MKNESVVLLHGLGRSNLMMIDLQNELATQGYQTWNESYPSTSYTIEQLAEMVEKKIRTNKLDQNKIHFVAHSMGSIITRRILSHHRPNNVGRVIMIAPPNHGTEIVDFFGNYRWFQRMYGPAALQIGTKSNEFLSSLPQPDYDLGIIAGNKSVEPWFSWFLLQGENDGKVTVESTKLNGMQEHIILPYHHASLPKQKTVIGKVSDFLRNGKFANYSISM